MFQAIVNTEEESKQNWTKIFFIECEENYSNGSLGFGGVSSL